MKDYLKSFEFFMSIIGSIAIILAMFYLHNENRKIHQEFIYICEELVWKYNPELENCVLTRYEKDWSKYYEDINSLRSLKHIKFIVDNF